MAAQGNERSGIMKKNEFILRCYYRVTDLETNLTGYRHLHALFIERYPEWSDLTEQRTADQCRVIKRNKLVPDLIANNVKEEVERERERDPKAANC
jgi:hypothetical protein